VFGTGINLNELIVIVEDEFALPIAAPMPWRTSGIVATLRSRKFFARTDRSTIQFTTPHTC